MSQEQNGPNDHVELLLFRADQLGLFIFQETHAEEFAVRHSLRLKAFCDAVQWIAYLTLLEQHQGWTREQTRSFVDQHIGWTLSVAKVNEADAGTPNFAGVASANLENLNTQLLKKALTFGPL